MSEIEVPIEAAQENIHHAAHHASDSEKSFMNRAALLAALLAAAAAVSALFAGHLANEALLGQIKSSDQWSYYQAKGIKASVAELKVAQGVKEAEAAVAKYKQEQQEIQKKAEELAEESEGNLRRHESLAFSVTLFQIAIAITAIAVLTRKKSFLGGSVLLGVLGCVWMIRGFL